MDNESNELNNGQTSESISKSRRKITKASLIATPIIASLSSRPVFATQCLSNILSGNLSHPDRGQCVQGLSPGYWKNHPEDWGNLDADTLISNGSFPSVCKDCTSGNGRNKVWNKCSGGTPFNSIFGGSESRTMLEVICRDSGSDEFHIIAAYLNTYKFPDYILTKQQVLDLWAGKYPEVTNLRAFLDSTWDLDSDAEDPDHQI